MNKIVKIACLILAAMMILVFPLVVSPVAVHAAVEAPDTDDVPGEDEEPEEEPLIPASRVIIDDYYVVGGGLEAGKTSVAVFVLRNTGLETSVNSVLVTGWIEYDAPVEFVRSNQTYVPVIPPDSTVQVEFEYSVKNVDLKSIDAVSAGFTIVYGDEGTETERTNSVSLRLPISSRQNAPLTEEDMKWTAPGDSALDRLLYSSIMRRVYVAGLVVCCAGVALILCYRLIKRIGKT